MCMCVFSAPGYENDEDHNVDHEYHDGKDDDDDDGGDAADAAA